MIKNLYDEIDLIAKEAAGYLCFWPVLEWKKHVYKLRAKPKSEFKPKYVYQDKDLKNWRSDMDKDYELNIAFENSYHWETR